MANCNKISKQACIPNNTYCSGLFLLQTVIPSKHMIQFNGQQREESMAFETSKHTNNTLGYMFAERRVWLDTKQRGVANQD